ncbi:hypothetical protein BT96DRAFT_990527 [Gymnopus androsaceus JB14]|uniref:Uncharacterized protein n=1 Tax=Gymnopus androsaceus JB14 TaxID=1447944 RepID=A0A6A4HZB5_9AGAR|nr:hypothetical protein BT96DRAFT_990527 [Gymnopus androsaceus JB14]
MFTAVLPEELLQAALENLAYNPEFIERETRDFDGNMRAVNCSHCLWSVANFDDYVCHYYLHMSRYKAKICAISRKNTLIDKIGNTAGLSLSMNLTHPVEITTNEPA